MKISLLTPTGDRPEALSLCMGWMTQQIEPFHEWVIIDDGVTASLNNPIFIKNTPITYIRRAPHVGKDTQRSNLYAGLERCTGDIVAFIEDDDFYHPTYTQSLVREFQNDYDIVGEARAIYYNVASRSYMHLGNTTYATLSQTAIHKNLIPTCRWLLTSCHNTQETLDHQLWHLGKLGSTSGPVHAKLKHFSEHVVGIKGMPGRAGIGLGHRSFGQWIKDKEDLSKLRELVGDDYQIYKRYIQQRKAA